MRIRRVAALAISAVAVTSVIAFNSAASASVPDPVPGNITAVASAPRIVPGPGMQLNPGTPVTLQIAGQTFGGVQVPSNATGVQVSITSVSPSAVGAIRVWTTEAGEPGTGAVYFAAGEQATNVAFVALNSAGKLNLSATAKTKFVMALVAYTVPEPAVAAPTIKHIDPVARKVIDVGGSIRTRHTNLGSVTLAPGTYDARVIGSFQGFNNVNNTVPADVTLTGTLVLTLGEEMASDFSNNVTVGGIAIPRSASDTLTQDPTAAISQFITLTETTEVNVNVFAYASNSSQAGSGELKAGLDSAVFVKL